MKAMIKNIKDIHPNDRIDYKSFFRENSELFDGKHIIETKYLNDVWCTYYNKEYGVKSCLKSDWLLFDYKEYRIDLPEELFVL